MEPTEPSLPCTATPPKSHCATITEVAVFGMSSHASRNQTAVTVAVPRVLMTKNPTLQPPSVLPDTAGSEWPAQQVWAGPLSGEAFVVVLWNLGQSIAAVHATRAEIGLQPSVNAYTVRDLSNHSWRPNVTASTGGVSALVQSHDVVALRLTPIGTSS